jgi:hypothetical protein
MSWKWLSALMLLWACSSGPNPPAQAVVDAGKTLERANRGLVVQQQMLMVQQAAATATHLICGRCDRWEAVAAVCVAALWEVGTCGHSHSWGVAQLAIVDHR